MSHVTLWKKLVESNNDGMLIFESDASCFSGVDTDALIQSFKKINNAHLLLFGTLMSGLFSGTTFTKLTNKFYGTHSYYITKKGAQTFLKYAFPIEQQIDSFMADIMMLSHLKNSIIDKIDAYVINVCNQRNNGTSIQTKQVKC
jgi:GR25 family glycosyltransferase involved in LPS biosynthesis